MDWFFLLLAGLFEIGWPLGFKLGWTTDGARPLPLVLAVLSMGVSGLFLFLAQRTIPIGTAYAVWTGIGSVGTFLIGLAFFKEPATAARLGCAALIVAGVVGMKVFGEA